MAMTSSMLALTSVAAVFVVLLLAVAWLLWRKAVRPQLTRRAEAMKAVQQQAQAREEVEDLSLIHI